MIGIFHRFLRTFGEVEPSVARRRLTGFSAGQLRALLSVARIYPPGLWSASADALRGVALRAYNEGRISDEQIEDIK